MSSAEVMQKLLILSEPFESFMSEATMSALRLVVNRASPHLSVMWMAFGQMSSIITLSEYSFFFPFFVISPSASNFMFGSSTAMFPAMVCDE